MAEQQISQGGESKGVDQAESTGQKANQQGKGIEVAFEVGTGLICVMPPQKVGPPWPMILESGTSVGIPRH